MASIYLIRHGQASFGAGDYDKLSRLGIAQARALGRALAAQQVAPTLVISGTMRRHRETARECLRELGRATHGEEDADWNEYDHQAMLEALDPRYRYQSLLIADLLRGGDLRRSFQHLFERAAARWAAGEFAYDYDESFDEFAARVERALRRLRARLAPGQSALVFSSGGAISALVHSLLGLSPQRTMELSYTLVNASVSKLVVGRTGVRLSSLNEHAHLETPPKRLVTYR